MNRIENVYGLHSTASHLKLASSSPSSSGSSSTSSSESSSKPAKINLGGSNSIHNTAGYDTYVSPVPSLLVCIFECGCLMFFSGVCEETSSAHASTHRVESALAGCGRSAASRPGEPFADLLDARPSLLLLLHCCCCCCWRWVAHRSSLQGNASEKWEMKLEATRKYTKFH